MDTKKGIEIGNIPSGGLNTTVAINCKNATHTKSETAVELNFDIHANVNASFESFVIYLAANNAAIANTKVTKDIVSLEYHNFDQILTSVITSMTDDFNLVHKDGINLV